MMKRQIFVWTLCFILHVSIGPSPFCSQGLSQESPLSLEECVQIGLKNRPEMEISNLDILNAEYQINEAQSYYLPRLNFNTGYTHFSGPLKIEGDVPLQSFKKGLPPELQGFIPNSLHAVSETGKTDWFAVDFNIIQPVYTFGRIEEGVRQARIGRSMAVNQKEKKRAEIIFEVKKGYYQFLAASEMVQFLTEADATTEVVAKMVRIGYETAVPEEKDEKGPTRIDYLKARNFHSEVKAKLSEAGKNLKLAELGLRIAMGLHPDAPLKVTAVPLESLPMSTWGIGELKEKTLEKNIDLKTVGLGIQYLDSRQKSATSEYFPKIGLFGNYVGPEDRFGNPNMWFAGVGLHMSLFDGLSTKARVGQAKAQVQKAKGQKVLLETVLSAQIGHLHTVLAEFKERAGIYESAIKEAKERAQLAADGYASGITDYEELLLAQKTEFELRAAYLQSLFLFQMTKSEIEYVSGVQ